MAQEEFKDYGLATRANIRAYLMDEFDLVEEDADRLISKHALSLALGTLLKEKAVDVGDRIIGQEPAL